MSFAKWLNVPPGKTASGTPASTATPAAHETVPSPPCDREHFRPAGRRTKGLFDIIVVAQLDNLGPQQGLSHFIDDARARSAT
jgi:hypothetical protein